jgi:hypothetical protein
MTFGTLSVAGGGTGATTLTGVVRGNGTSPQTAAELSGAVTTSGSNVTVMSTPFRVKSCSYTFGNTGADEPALASDTDEDDACMNDFGVAWTITAVACKADTATGTPTANVKQTTTGGSSILTGAISCGTSWTAGTLSGTPTVNSFSGSGNATCSSAPCNLAIDLTPGGTAKRITVKIVGTIPAS